MMGCRRWKSRWARRKERRSRTNAEAEGRISALDLQDVLAPTGNSAFDAYREGELAKLQDELRRLDAERLAFAAFLEDLKRARDRSEFDAFMSGRETGADAKTL